MATPEEEIEKLALSGIIEGFNKQSISIPSIAMRFLELEGKFSEEEAKQAIELYQKAVKEIMDGKNLTVCQLAAYHLLAELNLQRKANAIEKIEKPAPVITDMAYHG